MKPEVRTAMMEELRLFVEHPLNIKHQIIIQKLNFALLVDGQVVGSFIGPDRVLYVWCAVLLQRLKDALTAERYEVYDCWNPDVNRATPAVFYMRFNGFEWEKKTLIKVESSADPEVLCLLRAINQAKQRLWE